MRVPFLVLTPACAVLGIASAVYATGTVRPLHVALALLGAVLTHLSVNTLNEYFDFRSGLDFRTRRTPFSGGSGVLPQNPGLARYALALGAGALLLAALIGVYFLRLRGPLLLPVGLIGAVVIVAYTPWFAHQPVLCLLAPGLGFGLCMVMGTHFVLTGRYGWTAFLAALVPFFLVSDLLLFNQFPDVEADRSIGRRNFPILLGRKASSLLYAAFLLAAYLAIVFGVAFDLLPRLCLIGLLTLALAVPAAHGAYRHADDVEKLTPFLGMNVLINLLTPTLVAVGLFFG